MICRRVVKVVNPETSNVPDTSALPLTSIPPLCTLSVVKVAAPATVNVSSKSSDPATNGRLSTNVMDVPETSDAEPNVNLSTLSS